MAPSGAGHRWRCPLARPSGASESGRGEGELTGAGDPLADLLDRIEAGELGDPLPVVAYVAGRSVEIPDGELNEARRRALLLLVAGGDPTRELELDDRAVKAIAVDLHTDARRAALGAGLDELARLARERPRVRAAVLFLVTDVELAWRLYALGLLAEELG